MTPTESDIDRLVSLGVPASALAGDADAAPATNLDALYATLGARIQAQAAGSAIAEKAPVVQADAMNPALAEFGKIFFQRVQRACHDLICGSDDANKDARNKVLEAIKLNTPQLICAAIAGLLTAGLGIAGSIASALAVIIFQILVKPAGAALCQVWDEQLGIS
jgi:hypothetical protein